MNIDTSNATPFAENYFGKEVEDNRVVQGGASGNTVVQEGDTSLFGEQETLGKQDFLELLVTQLQYQDPLSPSENEEFVAQLAQFSSLETNQNIEASITDLNTNMSGFIDAQGQSAEYMTNASAANLIGKTGRISIDQYYNSSAGQQPINYHVEKAGVAYLELTNTEGEVVSRVPMNNDVNTGDFTFEWNGKNENGELVPPGDYSVRITDSLGYTNHGFAYVESPILGVTYKDGGSWLNMQDGSYELKDLKQIVNTNENENG